MTTLDVVVDHLRTDVPAFSGAQERGDLIVLPRALAEPADTPIPQGGVEVTGAAAHRLLSGDGPDCLFDRRDGGPAGLVLGVLTVPVDATALLVPGDDGRIMAFAQGTYEFRRRVPVSTARRGSGRTVRCRRT